MDTILMAVTALSLAMAAGMGAMLIRVLRLERRRSDARVELLEELAAARPEPRPAAAPPSRPTVPRPAPQRARVQNPIREMLARSRGIEDFELRPAAQRTVAGPDIFEEHEAPSAWPRRFAVIGVMAAVLFVVVAGWRTLGSSAHENSPATQSAQQSQTTTPSLELLSLQHAQQDGTLVISGLVQNPRGSAPLAGVQATVVLFDANGGTLATNRAPIDFTTLAPGDESSFVVRIPAAGAVSRYRVGFRGGDDRILAHVDRRNNETVARKQAP
jgi:hypothetical protein